jgi:hypothetical protein
MDPLFPEIPEDLAGLTDEELAKLEDEHRAAVKLIRENDPEFLGNREAEDVMAQLEAGVEAIQKIVAARDALVQAVEDYQAKVEELASSVEPKEETEEGETEGESLEVTAESDEPAPDDGGNDADEDGAKVEERELVTASAETVETIPARVALRRPPAPSAERQATETKPVGTALVAAGEFRSEFTEPLDADTLALAMREACMSYGPLPKDKEPGHYVTEGPHGNVIWDGPKHLVANAKYEFPDERTLSGNSIDDVEKIRAVLPEHTMFLGKPGEFGGEALVASGGLCAPLTPLYTMPNFGTEAEPVWDSFPTFRADRGGVNVPTPTTIADITTAISSISEANDALGGTFATKSCQSLVCPAYTETFVQILAHCREYGNLNARAWPEKIAHENALTMQALSRVSEGFMLDRIKSFFPNATNGATTLGSLIYVVEAIVRARFGIIGRLRMDPGTRFRALLPYWVPDVLMLDTVANQFDRYRSKDAIVAYLGSVGIDPVFYLDTPSTGTTQLPDSAQTAAAIDSTPAVIQWAIYPEGAVLGVDMGVLELGIVRDSTLNSTNDFQVFGERFRNVALLGPAQSGMWVTTTYCSQGSFPPAGTARTCP